MIWKIFSVFMGFLLLLSKIKTTKSSTISPTPTSVKSAFSTVSTTSDPQLPSTAKTSSITPTSSTWRTTSPKASKSSGLPPVPTHPPLPTSTPQPLNRTYDFFVTLQNYAWISEKYNNISIMPGKSNAFSVVYMRFYHEMNELFTKIGNFSDLKKMEYLSDNSILVEDNGKVRTRFKAIFNAASPGSKDPEIFLKSQNMKKTSNSTFFIVPSSIVVNETVEVLGGRVVLGQWRVQGVKYVPKVCCMGMTYENRTCNETRPGICKGLLLQRTFPCNLKYFMEVCGTVRRFTINMTLAMPWKEVYKTQSSSEFQKLSRKLLYGDGNLVDEVNKIFKGSKTGFKEIDVGSFSLSPDDKNVRITFTVIFNEPPATNPEDPEAVFLFKTESGKLGSFEFDKTSISVEENTNGYTFQPWKNKAASACDKCCGGEIKQERTCQSKMGSCPKAQLTRMIRCKHVCDEVKCGGTSKSVPYVLAMFICFLVSAFWI